MKVRNILEGSSHEERIPLLSGKKVPSQREKNVVEKTKAVAGHALSALQARKSYEKM